MAKYNWKKYRQTKIETQWNHIDFLKEEITRAIKHSMNDLIGMPVNKKSLKVLEDEVREQLSIAYPSVEMLLATIDSSGRIEMSFIPSINYLPIEISLVNE